MQGSQLKVERVAAFSQQQKGGNPAGVVLLDAALDESLMRSIAADVGYSETAFAVSLNDAKKNWRVRFFSPESEVPFCGHATIALGAILGARYGLGSYALQLNNAEISVNSDHRAGQMYAQLSSPPTRSRALSEHELSAALALVNLGLNDLDDRLAPAHIHAGADHLVLPLHSRARLAAMDYELDAGRRLMQQLSLVTIMLVQIEHHQAFNVRNAFASGGVLEDPATGAAAAALAGYLRDQGWPHGGQLTFKQGEDMGQPSVLEVSLSDIVGSPVCVAGQARMLA